jgi:hypothetical protein
MAQHDYNIEDQNGFDFLVDLNNALSAIVTNNAGSFEPNPTFAHMLWFDKNNDLMKVRNEANSAWVIVAKKDGSGWTPYRQGTALGTASVQPDDRYAHRSNNLSDLGSATTARANLMVIEDSSDPDFTNDPNAAARRGLVAAAIAAATATTQEDPYAGLAANLVAGGLGSLVFAYSTGGDVAFGGTVAGSALRPVGAARSVDGTGASNLYVGLESGSSLTGTWTCLGYFDSAETNTSGGGQPDPITIQGATLWQRTL